MARKPTLRVCANPRPRYQAVVRCSGPAISAHPSSGSGDGIPRRRRNGRQQANDLLKSNDPVARPLDGCVEVRQCRRRRRLAQLERLGAYRQQPCGRRVVVLEVAVDL